MADTPLIVEDPVPFGEVTLAPCGLTGIPEAELAAAVAGESAASADALAEAVAGETSVPLSLTARLAALAVRTRAGRHHAS
jgi:predicted nucleotidyltransferase